MNKNPAAPCFGQCLSASERAEHDELIAIIERSGNDGAAIYDYQCFCSSMDEKYGRPIEELLQETSNTPKQATRMENTAPQPTASPFAAPQSTPSAPAAAASPFAAPAQAGPAPSNPPTAEVGDTSYLDNLSAQEPLIKPCIVQCIITAMAIKTAENGNPFVSITVQLYGDKMVFEDGTPVPSGKRLTSSVFAASHSEEWLRLTGQELKGLMLALYDVPVTNIKQADATYASWPAAQKPTGPVRQGASFVFNMSCLEPTDRWIGFKALASVKIRKNKQTGESRNEFSLLAASTKPVERKGR